MVENNKSDYILKLDNLSHSYESQDRKIEAIKNINLQIDEGEFICLMGPSGCGKTTLLKVIAGYIKPSQGRAMLKGEIIEGPSKDRGVMFQSSTLYPWLSVRKNIEFGPKLLGVDKLKRQEISQRLLAAIHMEEFANSATFELSGGMKQRVALARVLANKPEMILMDEPFAALDAITKLKMHKIVRELWRGTRATIFMISHDIDEALSLATKLVIMSESPGQIEEVIPLKFTLKALEDPRGRLHIDDEYINIKERILDIMGV